MVTWHCMCFLKFCSQNGVMGSYPTSDTMSLCYSVCVTQHITCVCQHEHNSPWHGMPVTVKSLTWFLSVHLHTTSQLYPLQTVLCIYSILCSLYYFANCSTSYLLWLQTKLNAVFMREWVQWDHLSLLYL